MRLSRILCALTVLLMVLCLASPASAQLPGTKLPTLQAGDHGNGAATSDVVGGTFAYGRDVVPAPAISYGIPTAYGPGWRQIFGAAGIQRGLRGARSFVDGAVFGGMGLGDPFNTVGLEATLAVYALVGNPFEVRSLSLKLHRRIQERGSVALGVENLWIAGQNDGGRSAYAVGSYHIPLNEDGLLREVALTAGIGDGRFNSVNYVRSGINRVNPFGSISLRVGNHLSLLATWTGQDLNAGVSIAPFTQWPIVITPVVLDVTGHAGSAPRLAISGGIALAL